MILFAATPQILVLAKIPN